MRAMRRDAGRPAACPTRFGRADRGAAPPQSRPRLRPPASAIPRARSRARWRCRPVPGPIFTPASHAAAKRRRLASSAVTLSGGVAARRRVDLGIA